MNTAPKTKKVTKGALEAAVRSAMAASFAKSKKSATGRTTVGSFVAVDHPLFAGYTLQARKGYAYRVQQYPSTTLILRNAAGRTVWDLPMSHLSMVLGDIIREGAVEVPAAPAPVAPVPVAPAPVALETIDESPAVTAAPAATPAAERRHFWLPTRPYGVIDAINRMAAATGSVSYAQKATYADYNGHFVVVSFNDYRKYWTAEYRWGERVVLGRGDLSSCLIAARAEYDRGALGATVSAELTDPAQVEICEAHGYQPCSREIEAAHNATWRTPLHDKVNDAMALERHGLAPAVGFLANSKDMADYQAKLDAHYAERRAMLAAARGTVSS